MWRLALTCTFNEFAEHFRLVLFFNINRNKKRLPKIISIYFYAVRNSFIKYHDLFLGNYAKYKQQQKLQWNDISEDNSVADCHRFYIKF